MYFSGKNKIKFGLPIFKKNAKESQKRIILQYDSKTTVSVKYSNEKKEIISLESEYDHHVLPHDSHGI